MAEIIDGKLVSKAIRNEIAEEVAKITATGAKAPGLAVIVVGDDPASAVYVRNKHRACNEVGITSYQLEYDSDITEELLLNKIDELNSDDAVNGILVQLPLPAHISEEKVISAIAPQKDVDAFHPENVGKIMIGNYDFLPCTPAGIMMLLDYYHIDPKGKKCVVIGRSNIVGKPMAMLLLEKNGTVTVCHSRTADLKSETSGADILVAAVGKPNFVTADMVKDGAVVIDVGINRLSNGRLTGDVDFENVAAKASAITPVPGGVGPMTVNTLMLHTVMAAFNNQKK